MRALVFSDIHNKIERVRLLRDREENDYDAIIVSGDFGDDIAGEFFSVLDSFNCPSFCVYGNWDNKLSYTKAASEHCTLLHHNIERIDGFFITGFSGRPTHWGKNSFWLEAKEALFGKYQSLLAQEKEIEEEVKKRKEEVELKDAERHDALLKRTKDRRR